MTFAVTFGRSELILGIVTGLTYALLGVGLVLIYRASRVLHFGYGEIGAFGALVLGKLVLDGRLSWWVAFPVACAIGAAVSAAWERTVVRRLVHAPRSVLLVATIAIAQVMFAAQLLLPDVRNLGPYPTGLHFAWDLGGFRFRGDHLLVVLFAPAVALVLAWFLNRTVIGLAVRAAAENRSAARLAGVDVGRLSTLVWAGSGALATATFILILPLRGAVLGANPAAVGPTLLLRAFAVALIGRMSSLPATIAGGVLFGVAEVAVLANVRSPGTVDLVVFLGVLLLLLVRGAVADTEPGALASRARALPTAVARRAASRRLHRGAALLAVVVTVALPFTTSDPGRQYTFTRLVLFALIGMSVTVIAGWGGHLSLCQFAFVGLGAMLTSGLTDRGMAFGWALVYAAVVGAAAAALVGFPALRLKGPYLAIATLGFAVAARGWLLDQDVFFQGERRSTVARPSWGPVDFANQRSYYFLCVLATLVIGLGLHHLSRTGTGRNIVAVRDNEAAASAVTLPPAAIKLLAFALSGAVAGVAGGLLGGLQASFRPFDFGPEQSLQILTMTVIGGVGSVLGAVLGAVYLIGLPALLGGGTVAILLSGGVGTLVVVLFVRGGLLDLVLRTRDRILRVGSVEQIDDADGVDPVPVSLDDLRLPARPTSAGGDDRVDVPALECAAVEVRFGGLVANHAVSLQVGAGEIVGLIGTNGAGKSTLMNAVGGFVPIHSGTVRAFGQDITTWPAHQRAGLGIGRVFQDARLFGQMTVRECILVSLEARARSQLVADLLALPPARRVERARRAAADDLLDLTGLGDYADRVVGELSTGTRRIGELACLVGTGARLLLLDEPTGGVAQAEVEALGGVLLDVRRNLDASVLLIEHDMPLVMSLSDRVVCMTAGAVIASGDPEQIRSDPQVIAVYLGTDEAAIARSGKVGA